MTILNNEKARTVRVIIPDVILIIVNAVSILGIFIDICTTLLFGFGENFTSLKQLIVFVILATISSILGFGRKTTVSIYVNTDEKTLTADNVFKINIMNKNRTKEYNIQSKDIKCNYGLSSKDITIKFIYNKQKYKILLNGNKIENGDKIKDTLISLGVATKVINDNILN